MKANVQTRVPRGLLLLSIGLAAACQMPLAFQDPVAARQESQWQERGRFQSSTAMDATPVSPVNPPLQIDGTAPSTEPVPAADASLLDWGGGVVDGPTEGEVRTVGGSPTRGLEPSMEGRSHIIALYQNALDERDQLITEVTALQAALASSQKQLDTARSGNMERDTRISGLEEGTRRLTDENRAMAARLTTAQIRRLEAEKILLETQIAWHRDRKQSAAAVQPVSQGADGRQ